MAPSRWLFRAARRSGLTRHKPVVCIPNVLDRGIYKPVDKKIARQLLKVDPDRTVLAFGAVSIHSPYKGWAYLREAMQQLYRAVDPERFTVLIFGQADREAIECAIPFRTQFLGPLRDEYSLSLVYNAADVFIAPSLADNLPYTVLESLSCGTPVVAFRVGGLPDLIQHGHNGYLAKYRDPADIARGIRHCLEEELKGSSLPAFDNQQILGQHLELLQRIQKNIEV